MDRDSILERMAEPVWNAYNDHSHGPGPWKVCRTSPHMQESVQEYLADAALALDASGLMQRIAALMSDNTRLQKQVQIERIVSGRDPMAVWCTSCDVRSLDDYQRWLERQLRECLMIRANDPDKEMDDWISGKSAAFRFALLNFKRAVAAGGEGPAPSDANAQDISQPNNPPDDQPQPKE